MKRLLFLFVLLLTIILFYFFLQPKTSTPISNRKIPVDVSNKSSAFFKLQEKAAGSKAFLKQKGFSTQYIFLIDMALHSGKARFFIYNLQTDAILISGLVSHGSCNTIFLAQPKFSNTPECGCSSLGRYKIGSAYEGRFGKAFKLIGLDSTNSNAYKRSVVLHGYDCVPDGEANPYPICNSLGCPMVSYRFLKAATNIIERSKKPILLWSINDNKQACA
jgi:hypothetical protein